MMECEYRELLLAISNESESLRNLSYILDMFGDLDAEKSEHWAEKGRSVLHLTQDTVKNTVENLDEVCAELFRRIYTEECFDLKVRSDSMAPKLLPGDKVLIHQQNTIESGEIGVIMYRLKYYIGRIEVTEDHFAMRFDNPNYPPKTFERGGKDSLDGLVGKVVSVYRGDKKIE